MNKRFQVDHLQVTVADSSTALAELAAEEAAGAMRAVLRTKDRINLVVAGGESQQQLHRALRAQSDIAWEKVHAFAIDEFYAPQLPPECRVAAQPQRDLYSHVPIKCTESIDHAAADAEQECARYEQLIRSNPPDIVLGGIGCSGHLAFNEPGQAAFDDPQWVRVIRVLNASKQQLATDPNFRAAGEIPEKAITMTIPAILHAPIVITVVPYAFKAEIVKRFFDSDVTDSLPATILKQKDGASLWLDRDSYRLCQ